MNKIDSIKNRVIKNAFLELIDEDIQIEWKNLKDACFELVPYVSEGYCIEVDMSMKDAPQDVLEGGIAHDLAHIVDNPKSILGKISKRYLVYQERNVDLLVVLRGYGRQLLSFLRFAERKGYPRYKEDGLSIVELEKLLNITDAENP